jgi:uncharacterized protein (DUF433 family)
MLEKIMKAELDAFDLPDFLEIIDGGIRVTGHRVGLTLILEALFESKSIAEMREMYPTIPARTLWKVVGFCINHFDSMRNYYSAERLRVAALRAAHTDKAPSITELRKRKAHRHGRRTWE